MKTKKKTAPRPAKEQAPLPSSDVQLIPSRKQLAVLVVDEVNDETPITHALTYSGHTVTQASRAFEALSALQSEAFDLIFIDLGGKPLETFGTTELIVAFRNAQAQQIPIIALGPEMPSALEEKCHTNGVTRLINGRFDANALQQVLSNIQTGQTLKKNPDPTPSSREKDSPSYLSLSIEEHDSIYLPEVEPPFSSKKPKGYTWGQGQETKNTEKVQSRWGNKNTKLSRASIKSFQRKTELEDVALEACGQSNWKSSANWPSH